MSLSQFPTQTARHSVARSLNWRRVMSSRLVNAFAAPHGMSPYLESINPMWSLNRTRARVVERRNETADTVTFVLNPNGLWNRHGYRAGQFVSVTVDVDGVATTRFYSLSCPEGSRFPQITIKRQPDGAVSNHMHDRVQLGDYITLGAPAGEFILPETIENPLLFIAAGSGITPLMSMIETLLSQDHSGGLVLLYYHRSEADAIFGDKLKSLDGRHPNFRYQPVCEDQCGRFSATQLQTFSIDPNESQTFLCGPAPFMEAVEKHYADIAASDRLALERFTLPGQAPAVVERSSPDGDVIFARSERYAENSGRSLLEQAEAAGLRPEHGCRIGVCHSCTCRKTAGTVRNLQTGAISSGEEHIRICVSAPIGDVTLDI